MKKVAISFAVIGALIGNALAQGEETLATPVSRTAPPYPAECMETMPQDAPPQTVVLMFDINKHGNVENVRVRESTNACFDQVSVAAARQWVYEPRRVDGSRRSQPDMEVTLTFVINEETHAVDFDARPVARVPPQYPEKCMRRAETKEAVAIRFDITENGETENIRIIETTNKCLNDAAVKSVEKWQYHPKTVNGKAVARPGVETVITFVLADSSAKDFRVRSYVQSKLLRAQRLSKQPKKLAEASALLDEVYEDYGDSFSDVEMSMYHQVRAVVKINQKEYAAALDSLRIVQRTGLASDEAQQAIENTIYELEKALSAGQAAQARAHEAQGEPAGEGAEATEPDAGEASDNSE